MRLISCFKSSGASAASIVVLLLLTVVGRADLVSYYNFDDGATVTDQEGDNDGTVIHNAGFSSNTPDGSAFALDLSSTGVGVDQDYVRIGPEALTMDDPAGRDFGISETNSFTIATWINYSESVRGIVSIKHDLTSGGGAADRSGITFGIDGSGAVFVGMIPDSGGFRDVTTDQIVPAGEWVHLAATYDVASDKLTTYLGGLPANTYNVTPAGSMNPDGTNATGGAGIDLVDEDGSFTGFGASGNGPEHGDSAGDFTRMFYDGLIDDVYIYNHALSRGEIVGLITGQELLPGDADFDNDVDIDDYLLIRAHMFEPDPFDDVYLGDVNNDAFVDFADFHLWKDEFPGGAAAAEAAIAALGVPEPSTLGLTALGLTAWLSLSKLRRIGTRR